MTAAHGHAALFRVYDILSASLMLFCLHGLYARSLYADRPLKPTFWGLNIGLAIMVFMSLLPAGIYRAWASVTKGMWYTRSPEVARSKMTEALVWLRMSGDVMFAISALVLAQYALRLLHRPKVQQMESLLASARATH